MEEGAIQLQKILKQFQHLATQRKNYVIKVFLWWDSMAESVLIIFETSPSQAGQILKSS